MTRSCPIPYTGYNETISFEEVSHDQRTRRRGFFRLYLTLVLSRYRAYRSFAAGIRSRTALDCFSTPPGNAGGRDGALRTLCRAGGADQGHADEAASAGRS